MKIHRRVAVLCGPVLASAYPTYAQGGSSRFGSYSGGYIDRVDNATLISHVTIPVLKKPGRGLDFSYASLTTRRYGPGYTGNQLWVPKVG